MSARIRANVRDDERSKQNQAKESGQVAIPEYGVFTKMYELAGRLASRLVATVRTNSLLSLPACGPASR